jgi:hypothetical protein
MRAVPPFYNYSNEEMRYENKIKIIKMMYSE